jgi:hypothetical protein
MLDAVNAYMFDHIPAGVDPSGHSIQLQIEDTRDGLHMEAADEHGAFMEAIAKQAQRILTEYENLSRRDFSYEVTSSEYGAGAMVFSLPEEASAFPSLIHRMVEPFRGEGYVELRAEGNTVSPDYGMDSEGYKYVFHYG